MAKSQELDNAASDQEDPCFYIYECCKKIETDCVEYCEPEIRCSNNSTNKILGFEGGVGTTVIAVNCRKGFRY